MPGFHWSRSFAFGPASRWANALITPSTWSTASGSGGSSSRTAWCSAVDSGRRSAWSGRASSLPVPQCRRTAAERSALSSTVLPTPRSPVSTSERSGRPVRDALEHDVEGAQLLVTTGQLRRSLAGAGRVRVPDRVHDPTVSRRLAESVDFASASERRLSRRRTGPPRTSVGPGAAPERRVRRVETGAEYVDQVGHLVHGQLEGADADVCPPQREHHESRFLVPGDPQRARRRGRPDRSHPIAGAGWPACLHDAPGRWVAVRASCHRVAPDVSRPSDTPLES